MICNFTKKESISIVFLGISLVISKQFFYGNCFQYDTVFHKLGATFQQSFFVNLTSYFRTIFW